MIEGEKEFVHERYRTIEDENRHHGVEILHEGSSNERIFTKRI
ncbi:BLUF domain-containing protein [uncultured Croceitalea sp.]